MSTRQKMFSKMYTKIFQNQKSKKSIRWIEEKKVCFINMRMKKLYIISPWLVMMWVRAGGIKSPEFEYTMSPQDGRNIRLNTIIFYYGSCNQNIIESLRRKNVYFVAFYWNQRQQKYKLTFFSRIWFCCHLLRYFGLMHIEMPKSNLHFCLSESFWYRSCVIIIQSMIKQAQWRPPPLITSRRGAA